MEAVARESEPVASAITDGAAPSRAEVAEQARLVGLRQLALPTLEDVERRRFQLWIVSLVLLVGAIATMVMASIWPGAGPSFISPLVLRVSMLGLAAGFAAYTVEKERHLRRLTRLLVDERVLTSALANRLSEVRALLEAGKAINSVLELDSVLDIILGSATQLLRSRAGSVMLLHGDVLSVVCAHGNDEFLGAESSIDDGIAGQVARSREAALVSGNTSGRRHQVDSALCVPLIHRDELLGVLNVNGGDGCHFTEYDLRALSLFAEQAAAAIANARLYEVERTHVAELVELEMRKTEFLAAVSHDLRTPLTSLVACTKMMQRRTLTPLQRAELTEMADRQASRLAQMIEDLLMAARLESETPPALAGISATDVVRDLAAEYAVTGQTVEIEAPAGVHVLARSDSFRRIVTNLVDNAFKYGGAPVQVILAPDPDGESVTISVVDHGTGIARDDRDRVFERFFRSDAHRSTTGIGLGLSIVRGLVAGCGGEVWVEAPEGGGTAVRIRLRAAERVTF